MIGSDTKPARTSASKATAKPAKPITPQRIRRTMPNRSPSGPAAWLAEKKPTALIAKASEKPVGVRPNWST